MKLQASTAQVLLIDFQAKLMPAIAQGQTVLANAQRLAQLAQWFSVPVFASEQNPDRLGSNDAKLAALVNTTFTKMQFSACSPALLQALSPAELGSKAANNNSKNNVRSLPGYLQKPQVKPRDQIVLAGCETHVCLLQTALDLLEQDLDVWVVSDACGSRHSHDKDAALDRLAGNGVELVTLEMLAFEWLESAEHLRFKDVLALVK